jgi:hypothetical protein
VSQPESITVSIDRDEWYPVFSISTEETSYGERCVIPAALADRAAKALAEFDAVQDELGRIWRGEA